MNRITDLEIDNKTIILRCDYNVPIENGVITDASRIEKSIPTINYLLEHHCKIVILSHMGRIKTEEDKLKYDLKIVADELSRLLSKKIIFVSECYGHKVKEIVSDAALDSIILLQNTRFMDIPEKWESGNDLKLAKYWSSLGDVFILDAFGSCHRAHASTAGIAKFLPSGIGYLVEKELDNLEVLININERPFTIFMGGAKVEDKLPIIKKLLPKSDYLLLGGGIANSFLKASGIDVGDSLSTNDYELLGELKQLLISNANKIILPCDFIYDGTAIMDVGNKTLDMYQNIINQSKLIFINGTPGKFEEEPYSSGTKALLKILAECYAKVLAGGGDTINAIQKFGFENKFAFESSGGGATLEYIANGELEALRWLK